VNENPSPRRYFSIMGATPNTTAKQFRGERSRFEQTMLLLQGGGALGSAAAFACKLKGHS
jgi:hypothetical protein